MRVLARVMGLSIMFILTSIIFLQLSSFNIHEMELSDATTTAMTSTQIVEQENIEDDIYDTTNARKVIDSNTKYQQQYVDDFAMLVGAKSTSVTTRDGETSATLYAGLRNKHALNTLPNAMSYTNQTTKLTENVAKNTVGGTRSTYKITFMETDWETGILSVKVQSTYAMLNGEYKTIETYKTNIIENNGVDTIKRFNIFFNANGGVCNESVRNVQKWKKYGELPIPQRKHYTFLGWYTELNGGTKVSANTIMGNGDVTLYAHWEANPFKNTIKHYVMDGDKKFYLFDTTNYTRRYEEKYQLSTSEQGLTVPKGLALNTYGTTHVTGSAKEYPFGTQVTQKAEDMEYEFYYKTIDYKVTYNLNGGTNANGNKSSYNVLHGFNLGTPTKRGYTFLGWYDENGQRVTTLNGNIDNDFKNKDDMYNKLNTRTVGNKVLTAKWKANEYTITYDGNGATSGSMSGNVATYDSAYAIQKNQYVRKGYTFIGWTTKADGTSDGYGWTSYAKDDQWKGEGFSDKLTNYNVSYWSGTWKYIDGQYGIQNGKMKLYAMWQINQYKIDLNCVLDGEESYWSHTYGTVDIYVNGKMTHDDVSDANVTLNYGDKWELKDIKSTKGHYYVKTTYSEYGVNGKKVGTSGTIGEHGVSLYPEWNTKVLGIHYHRNYNASDTTMANQSAKYGVDGQKLDANPWNRAGYAFLGWSTDKNATKAEYSNQQSISNDWIDTKYPNIHLYAVWKPYTLTVRYHNDGAQKWRSYANGDTEINVEGKDVVETETVKYDEDYAHSEYGLLDVGRFTRTGYHENGNWKIGSKTSTNKVKDASNTLPNSKGQGLATYLGVINAFEKGDVTVDLYPELIANTYTVKYNGNGENSGTTPSSSHTYDTAKNLTANGYIKNGYQFVGWNTQTNGSGTSYSDKQNVKNLTATNGGVVTLYAQWKPYTLTIRYHGDGALKDGTTNVSGKDVLLEEKVAYNGSYSHLKDATKLSKDGYTPNNGNWIVGKNGTTVVSSSKSLANGETVGIYLGCINSFHKSNVTVDLYPEWIANTWTVKYDANGGNGGMENTTHVWNGGIKVRKNTFERPLYTFRGWNLSRVNNGKTEWLYYKSDHSWPEPDSWYESGQQPSGYVKYKLADEQVLQACTLIKNDVITAHAQWTANTYYVTYDANGGSGAPAQQAFVVDSGTKLSTTKPTRTGYTFVNWDYMGNKFNPGDAIPTGWGSFTLKAQWKANTYTVTYNANNGSGSMSPSTATYNSNFLTKKNEFTRTGYTFNGWSAKPDGSAGGWGLTDSGVYESSVPWKWTYTNDITLYAQWKPNTYAQIIQARYQNADGTWGSYSTVKSGNANYNATYSWSRAADSTYKAASISYTVTQANTKYVDVYRQMYNLKVTGDSGVESISGNGDYYAGSTASSTYKIKAGYHMTTLVGQGPDAGQTWTGYNNKTGTLGDTWGMSRNRQAYINTAKNTVSIAYGVNGGTINSSDYSINQWGYVQNKSNNPWFHVVTYGSKDDPYNASTFGLTRTGYTFVRWQNEKAGTNYDQDTQYDSTVYQGSSSSETTANTSSVNCYVKAIWSLDNYSIGYNLNGGSISGQKTSYNVTTESFTLPTPTRTGYTFTGWTGSNGSTPQKSVTITKGSTGNKSYTANWQANAYTLTVNPNGGNINGTTSAKSLSPPLYYNGGNWWNLSGEKPSRTGYTFEGWYTSANGGTKIYNADGTCTNEGTYWKNSSYVHTGNLSVYAHWKANTYTITSKYFYYYQNNTWKQFDTKTEQRTYGSSFAPHNVNSPTGYHAGNNYGYYTEKSEYLGGGTVGTNNITVNQNIIVHVHYYPNTYAITYKPNGGSDSDQAQTVTYGISWTTKGAIYSKSGYTQTSWNTQANGSGTKYSLSTAQTDKQLSNITLYAQYSANTYYVTYDANGGSGAPAQQAFVVDSGTKLSTTKPTRTGYTFVNWDYMGNKFNPGDAIPTGWGSFTLKAQWKANTYTVTYNANNGSGSMSPSTATYNSNFLTKKNEFTRTGYTFNGWSAKPDGSAGGWGLTDSGVYESSVPWKWTYTNDITLYAQWKPNTYAQIIQARYQNADGTWGSYSTVKSGNANYNATYSWSRAADSTYKAASISYTVTQANTKYVDVYRQMYNLKVTGDSGVESISGNGDYYAGSTASSTYKIKAGYHMTTLVGQGPDAGQTWTGYNNKTGTLGDTWGMSRNRQAYINTAKNTVSIAYGVNGGTINSSDYSINQWGYVQNKSNNPWFHVVTYGSKDDPYNASTFGLTRTGYTFVRWQNEKAGTNYDQDTQYDSTVYQGSSSSETTANTSSVNCYVKAIWSLDNYSIGYNLNGGSISGQKTSYNVTTESFTLPTPTRTGYTFTGWTGSNGSTPQKSVTIAKGSTGNKSYTANWSVNMYYFDLNGYLDGASSGSISGYGTCDIYMNGTLVANDVADFWQQYAYGTKYEIKDIKTATGKQYLGVQSGSLSGTITGTTSTYLSFKTNSTTIQYDANGGSGAPGNQTKVAGQTLTLSSTKPTRSGYTFRGWKEISKTNKYYQPGSSYTNDYNGETITMRAVWVKNSGDWGNATRRDYGWYQTMNNGKYAVSHWIYYYIDTNARQIRVVVDNQRLQSLTNRHAYYYGTNNGWQLNYDSGMNDIQYGRVYDAWDEFNAQYGGGSNAGVHPVAAIYKYNDDGSLPAINLYSQMIMNIPGYNASYYGFIQQDWKLCQIQGLFPKISPLYSDDVSNMPQLSSEGMDDETMFDGAKSKQKVEEIPEIIDGDINSGIIESTIKKSDIPNVDKQPEKAATLPYGSAACGDDKKGIRTESTTGDGGLN